MYSLENIAAAIKTARKQKQLSQRALSAKIGVPQSHISKIENGMIDLQVSSLITISRALGLELMLVPRKLIPTVQAFQRKTQTQDSTLPKKFLTNILNSLEILKKHAYKSTPLFPKIEELKKTLSFTMKGLEQFHFNRQHAEQIKTIMKQIQSLLVLEKHKPLKTSKNTPTKPHELEKRLLKMNNLIQKLYHIRNKIIHEDGKENFIPRPAYHLDDDGDV